MSLFRGCLLNPLASLKLALPILTAKVSESLPTTSPLRKFMTNELPELFFKTVVSMEEQFLERTKIGKIFLSKVRKFDQKIQKIPKNVRDQIRNKVSRCHYRIHSTSTSRRNYSLHTRSTRQYSSQSHLLYKNLQGLQKNPKTQQEAPPSTTTRQYPTQRTSIRRFSDNNALSHTLRGRKLPLKNELEKKNKIFTNTKRNFRFRRYREQTRWNLFHYHADIFSPLRTLTTFFRRGAPKLKRFLPGRFAGYTAYVWTGVAYSWFIILLLERNRQFDAGWINPEMSNWGHFLKRDWAYANPMYDVEIFKKRRKFQKMDGNRFMHEEDLKVDKVRPQRWKWMFPEHVDRFAKPDRGIWPLRSYVINSPQYVDRRYLSRGYEHRRDKFGKWIKVFGDARNQSRQKKRALRLRGGKYEYGGTAQHYYFTKVHDRDRLLTGPDTFAPKYARHLHDTAKY